MKMRFVGNPDNSMKHVHAVSLCNAGEFCFAAWYGYPEEEHRNACIYISRRAWNGDWQPVRAPIGKLNKSSGNPVLCYDADANILYCYFVILQGVYWDSAKIHRIHSKDLGLTWSTSEQLALPEGMMLRHRPVKIGQQWVFPLYDEKKFITHLYRSSYLGGDWELWQDLPEGTIQGDIVEGANGAQQMYLRPHKKETRVMKTLFHPAQNRWSQPLLTNLFCPLSGIAAARLRNYLVVVHNHTEEHCRYPLHMSISDDFGMTWKEHRVIDQTEDEVSYPSLCINNDGGLEVAYSFKRLRIKILSFTEGEILS